MKEPNEAPTGANEKIEKSHVIRTRVHELRKVGTPPQAERPRGFVNSSPLRVMRDVALALAFVATVYTAVLGLAWGLVVAFGWTALGFWGLSGVVCIGIFLHDLRAEKKARAAWIGRGR